MLEIQFSTDYDINIIHRRVLEEFAKEAKILPYMKMQLEDLEKVVMEPQTVMDRKISTNRIKKLSDKIDDIENEISFKKYNLAAEDIIRRYKDLGKDDTFYDPFSKRTIYSKGSQSQKKLKERIRIIMEFVNLARNYININIFNESIGTLQNCNICGMDISNIPCNLSGMIICPECYCQQVKLKEITTQKNKINKSDYSNHNNFRKSFLRFQGNMDKKLPKDNTIVKDLEKYFTEKGMELEAIRDSKPDEYGKKPGTNLEMLISALKELEYSKYYNCANYLGRQLWGWKLHELNSIEEIIMDDYAQTQRVYENLDKDRSSSLNVEFRLFKHLQARGIKCRAEDFKLPRDLVKQEELWFQMVKGANVEGLEYYSLK